MTEQVKRIVILICMAFVLGTFFPYISPWWWLEKAAYKKYLNQNQNL